MSEITDPVDLVIDNNSSYYRVVLLDDLKFQKNNINKLDMNMINFDKLSSYVEKHVKGNGYGKAPETSPFFSVTNSIQYARKFAQFLMQQHDVAIICLNNRLKIINPICYLKGSTHINWSKGAKEYLVANQIPFDTVNIIYIFGQKIFESCVTYKKRDFNPRGIITYEDLSSLK